MLTLLLQARLQFGASRLQVVALPLCVYGCCGLFLLVVGELLLKRGHLRRARFELLLKGRSGFVSFRLSRGRRTTGSIKLLFELLLTFLALLAQLRLRLLDVLLSLEQSGRLLFEFTTLLAKLGLQLRRFFLGSSQLCLIALLLELKLLRCVAGSHFNLTLQVLSLEFIAGFKLCCAPLRCPLGFSELVELLAVLALLLFQQLLGLKELDPELYHCVMLSVSLLLVQKSFRTLRRLCLGDLKLLV
mmetsp:Transcript_5663/g.20610  ORF Transcript_5663/g.20610 Transcript_5663/m.20610 type:complete len:245 (+) Transcript_5663:1198-1932(+)